MRFTSFENALNTVVNNIEIYTPEKQAYDKRSSRYYVESKEDIVSTYDDFIDSKYKSKQL